MRNNFIAAVVAAFTITSCATYNVHKAKNSSEAGIRFYQPRPYLMVKEGADKGLVYDVIYLPDYSNEYIVKKKGFIGTANVTIKLENGWNVTDFGSTYDSKTPETLTALAGLLPALMSSNAANSNVPASSAVKPGLYKLKFNTAGELEDIIPVKHF